MLTNPLKELYLDCERDNGFSIYNLAQSRVETTFRCFSHARNVPFYLEGIMKFAKGHTAWNKGTGLPKRIIAERYYQRHPWLVSYFAAQYRCIGKKCSHYKKYGGRGIKFLATKEDFKKLWFRDKAHLMKKPSIDRIDSNGDYVFNNCRFIELKLNQDQGRINRWKNWEIKNG